MKFSIDMDDDYSLPDTWVPPPEFVVVQPASGRGSPRVYDLIECHWSRRTPRRLICEVEPLGVVPIDGHPAIYCARRPRKRKRR